MTRQCLHEGKVLKVTRNNQIQEYVKDGNYRAVRRGMSVAVIGPDGAGKSTLVQALHEHGNLPSIIVYMGGNAAHANHTLPTTRWLTSRWLARNDHASKPQAADANVTRGQTGLLKRSVGGLYAVVKLLHEMLEYSYRFMVAYAGRRRGAVVLYDRYIYDSLLDAMVDSPTSWEWFRASLFKRVFPRPDLLIVLEAPGELLFERKREHSPERLERMRDACRQIAQDFELVEYIDATRPPGEVAEQALAFINVNLANRSLHERRLSIIG